eukprot:8355725-Pyramimonas_sp.AAC.2
MSAEAGPAASGISRALIPQELVCPQNTAELRTLAAPRRPAAPLSAPAFPHTSIPSSLQSVGQLGI